MKKVFLVCLGLFVLSFYAFADADTDGDTVGDDGDNCPTVSNLDQADLDIDGLGNVCDTDADGDTYLDVGDGGNDCNDLNAAINPGATEACNDVDDDCDGSADENITLNTFYADEDADTYGDAATSVQTCHASYLSYVSNSTDCNDASSTIYPGATETVNSIDDDCDGSIDEGTTTYYQDVDGDGCGNAEVTAEGYTAPTGYVSDSSDCNDADATICPTATDTPDDGIDQDCDGADASESNGGDTAAASSGCSLITLASNGSSAPILFVLSVLSGLLVFRKK